MQIHEKKGFDFDERNGEMVGIRGTSIAFSVVSRLEALSTLSKRQRTSGSVGKWG